MKQKKQKLSCPILHLYLDEKKRLTEEKALLDLWLAMDEIKAKVSYVQPELSLNYGQMSLNLETDETDD
jgi:putative DNA methylase